MVQFYSADLIELNPFPHIDAFWRLCRRQLFENIVTKEEIAQNVQLLLLPRCFPLLVRGYPFNYRDFLFFYKNMFKVVCCRIVVWGKGLNSFQCSYSMHTSNIFWWSCLSINQNNFNNLSRWSLKKQELSRGRRAWYIFSAWQ